MKQLHLQMTPLTLELVDEFLADMIAQGYSQNSMILCRAHLRFWVRWLKEKRITIPEESDVMTFVSESYANNLPPLTSLRSFYTWAKTKKYLYGPVVRVRRLHPGAEPPLVAAFRKFLLDDGRSPDSVNIYASFVKTWLLKLKEAGVEQPTRAHYDEFYSHLSEQKKSYYLTFLRAFYSWAAASNCLPHEPPDFILLNQRESQRNK